MENIKEADYEDLPRFEWLLNAAFRGIGTDQKGWTMDTDYVSGKRAYLEDLQESFKDPQTIYYKYISPSDPKEILGCANIEFLPDRVIYIGNFAVDPGCQNRGIGKDLLNFIESWAFNNQMKKLRITVTAPRVELQEWYMRKGYEKTGEKEAWECYKNVGTKQIPDLHLIAMEKTLKY